LLDARGAAGERARRRLRLRDALQARREVRLPEAARLRDAHVLNLRVEARDLDPEILFERQLDGLVRRQAPDGFPRLRGGVLSGCRRDEGVSGLAEYGHRGGQDDGGKSRNPAAMDQLRLTHGKSLHLKDKSGVLNSRRNGGQFGSAKPDCI
jgi:hypothetical protein